MTYEELTNILDSIMNKDEELHIYYKGKELKVKEFAITIDGEHKIILEK